jgi:regulatory protein
MKYEDDYIKTITRIYEDYYSKQKGLQEYQKKQKP